MTSIFRGCSVFDKGEGTDNFPDYCLDPVDAAPFWQAQRERFETYLQGCRIVDPGDYERDCLISVLVTSYNSEAFVEDCLGDLQAQLSADTSEIIFIDAHSPQDEEIIVRRFQESNLRIRYVRTPERISVYAAWNLAACLARGNYLTSFSTNDRLGKDAHQLLARALDDNPAVMLVYGDTHITSKPHETFDNFTIPPAGSKAFNWPDYNFLDLLRSSGVGPHPMWRRKVHDQIGYWDERFQALGDQEFFLRVAEHHPLLHIKKYTGLYWHTDKAVSNAGWIPVLEDNLIRMRYWQRFRIRHGTVPCAVPSEEQSAEVEGLVGSSLQALNARNLLSARNGLEHVLRRYPDHAGALSLMGLLAMHTQQTDLVLKYLTRAIVRDPLDKVTLERLAFYGKQTKRQSWVLPFLKESMKIQPNGALLKLVEDLEESAGIDNKTECPVSGAGKAGDARHE